MQNAKCKDTPATTLRGGLFGPTSIFLQKILQFWGSKTPKSKDFRFRAPGSFLSLRGHFFAVPGQIWDVSVADLRCFREPNTDGYREEWLRPGLRLSTDKMAVNFAFCILHLSFARACSRSAEPEQDSALLSLNRSLCILTSSKCCVIDFVFLCRDSAGLK